MSICSNFALNAYLPIYLFIYLLLIVDNIFYSHVYKFRFRFVYVREGS